MSATPRPPCAVCGRIAPFAQIPGDASLCADHISEEARERLGADMVQILQRTAEMSGPARAALVRTLHLIGDIAEEASAAGETGRYFTDDRALPSLFDRLEQSAQPEDLPIVRALRENAEARP